MEVPQKVTQTSALIDQNPHETWSQPAKSVTRETGRGVRCGQTGTTTWKSMLERDPARPGNSPREDTTTPTGHPNGLESRLLWIPELKYRGPQDILNESSILKRIKALPGLDHVVSDDILDMKFLLERGQQNLDPTRASSDLPAQVLERKKADESLGSDVIASQWVRYHHPLSDEQLLDKKTITTASVLRGEAGVHPL
ncbi:hypothetical protein NDU88_004862 [Pleurodeles waltl]|uniref:Uncharacterized protein n=1 Tax=Pleurodeles waltl TaxID=8319 RepID=A0AAV7SK12_PLEWA|nr:hypothetical protein NDU88_004862 [Pleurodeles waltl]